MHYGKGMTISETELEYPEQRGASSTVPARYHYYTYGLQLSSQLELTELSPVGHCPDPDVDILTNEVEEVLENARFSGPWLQLTERCCQFMVGNIARYRIEEGRRILVDRRVLEESGCGASSGDVRLYLLGAALGVLLHQRHWLPLHVSALQTPSGVWAFTGHSGAGKSTLGAWLHYCLGWPMVSDDVAVVKPEDEQPYLYPGPPRLKLWKDALAALGIEQHGLVRDLTRVDKYHLMLQKGFQMEPQPLRALVILERAKEGEAASVEPVKGVAAFQAVMASFYRLEFGKSFTCPAQLLRDVSRLAGQIDVYRFRRPWSLDAMDSNIEPLIQRIVHG